MEGTSEQEKRKSVMKGASTNKDIRKLT